MVEPIAGSALPYVPKPAGGSHAGPASRSSVALNNMRGIVILIVLGFHSALAYVTWVAAPTADFDAPPYNWRAFPIVDSHRFFGFDLFCAWQDVYLMSLMFFLSGVFVFPSLMRKKNGAFLRDRLARLGIPYLVGVFVVIPLATYPAYLLTAADPSVWGYWRALAALPFWPNGPLWFLWQLLALTIVAAFVNWAAPGALRALGRWSAAGSRHVGLYFVALLAVSALAYVPLALAFTPWKWMNYGLLAVQLCRPLQYAVYFFAGVGVGVEGIDHGLLAADGPLPRHWALWLAAALSSLALWMGATYFTLSGGADLAAAIPADLAYVLACAAGCFFLIAVSLRFAAKPSLILGNLGADAYALYLLHYVFVVWLQYALLALDWFAMVKVALVFSGTLIGTWALANGVQRLPFGARLIGFARRPARAFAAAAPPGSAPQSPAGGARST
jgi:glucans biosynthesis protein C